MPVIPNYPFAEPAVALLAVKYTSAGQISVYSLRRNPGDLNMSIAYFTQSRKIPDGALALTAAVDPACVGLFTVEAGIWPVPYCPPIIRPLGQVNPFGVADIPYDGPRPASIPAHRTMNCGFFPGGDVVVRGPTGDSSSTFRTAALDGPAIGSGIAWLSIRVTEANYRPNCVTFDFASGFGFDSMPGPGPAFTNRSQFVLP